MTDQEVLNKIQQLFKNKKGQLINGKVNKHNIQINNPDIYEYLANKYFDFSCSVGELIYRLENGVNDIPLCPVCGTPLKFIKYCKGYQTFCSNECKYSEKGQNLIQDKIKDKCREQYGCDYYLQSDIIKDKGRQTSLQKYGVTHPAKSNIVKLRSQQTCLERYGVKYSAQSDNNKRKFKQTLLQRYGVDTPMKSNIIKQKYKQTCVQRYGSEYYVQCNKFTDKANITKYLNKHYKWEKLGYDIEFLGHSQIIVHNCCDIHKDVQMHISTLFNRLKAHTCLCTECNPLVKGPSSYQEIFIQNYLTDENICFYMHDKNILNNKKELDFYIPDLNLAIECNGIYWHSDKLRDITYHYNKTKECNEQNITLLHIWEDQFNNNLEYVLNIINYKINHNIQIPTEYYINSNITDNSIIYTCMVDSTNILTMTFTKDQNEYQYILDIQHTYAYNVFSIIHEILHLFIENYKFNEIIIIDNLDIDNSKDITNLGFYFVEYLEPTPFYINNQYIRVDQPESMDNIKFKCYNSGYAKYSLKNKD